MINSIIQPNDLSNEESLLEDLVIERIQMSGMDLKFMPLNAVVVDDLFKENLEKNFNDAYTLEFSLETVEGFDTNNMFADFGLELSQTATFMCSIKRFKEVTALEHPKMGDLIYIPHTNALIEITNVVDDDPFFQTGKKFVFTLECKLYEYSQEDIDTGDADIDALISELDTVDVDPNDNDHNHDNDVIEAEADLYKTFDESNPFGVD